MTIAVEPLTIEAGTSLAWSRTFPDYPSATWTLIYTLVNKDNSYSITATPNVTDLVSWDVAVLPTTTDGYEAGRYRMIAHVADGTDRHRVWESTIEITPDVSAGDAVDVRTDSRRILDAVNASIEGHATRDQQSQQIGGRMIQRHTLGELMRLKASYEHLVNLEEGKTNSFAPSIGVTFGRH